MKLWLKIFLALVLMALGLAIMNSSSCPLVKQGCDCGRICTKKFDCVRGQHE